MDFFLHLTSETIFLHKELTLPFECGYPQCFLDFLDYFSLQYSSEKFLGRLCSLKTFLALGWKAILNPDNLVIIFGYNFLIKSPGLLLDFELIISNLIILIQFSISALL